MGKLKRKGGRDSSEGAPFHCKPHPPITFRDSEDWRSLRIAPSSKTGSKMDSFIGVKVPPFTPNHSSNERRRVCPVNPPLNTKSTNLNKKADHAGCDFFAPTDRRAILIRGEGAPFHLEPIRLIEEAVSTAVPATKKQKESWLDQSEQMPRQRRIIRTRRPFGIRPVRARITRSSVERLVKNQLKEQWCRRHVLTEPSARISTSTFRPTGCPKHLKRLHDLAKLRQHIEGDLQIIDRAQVFRGLPCRL